MKPVIVAENYVYTAEAWRKGKGFGKRLSKLIFQGSVQKYFMREGFLSC